MADKNKGVSETFGKYTDSGKGRSTKVDGPKNITSDMWTPISAGKNEEKKTADTEKSPRKKSAPQQKKSASKKKAPSDKDSAKKTGLISEGRKKEVDGKKGKTSEKKNKKSPRKSRTPKGRPVSELGDDFISKQRNAEKVRNHQKLSKAERDYDDGLKGGKSPGELSKERADYKRKKRLRQNIIIIVVFLIFALAFAGVYTYSKGAPVGVITVEGESIYTYEEIVSAAELEIGVNMLSVNEAEVSAKVSSALPYIHSVEMKKKLPDKLILTVTSTEEKYLLSNKKGSVVLDVHGKVLSNGEGMKLTDGLFRVYGVGWESYTEGTAFVPTEKTAEKYNLAVDIITALEKEGVIPKATVNVSDKDNVRVYCIDGESEIMIYLGSCKDTEKRIALASKVMETPEVSGKTGYIDIRFDNAYFREGSINLS
ncbi:MAG: FtsQ-type POTRA domain-containing protein [Clostridia bacterium]|nr:FtsQ-type POTRA domain-containing protein [Clostridia bacterium]